MSIMYDVGGIDPHAVLPVTFVQVRFKDENIDPRASLVAVPPKYTSYTSWLLLTNIYYNNYLLIAQLEAYINNHHRHMRWMARASLLR